MTLDPVVLNGKFLAAHPTGVHRVAAELIGHLDDLLAARGTNRWLWSLICPRDARAPLPVSTIERRTEGLTTWQVWEQFELPGLARNAVLVNLCNLAPLRHRRSVTLIHDAQVFLTPESYSKTFLAWYRFALPRIGANAARIVTVSDYSRDQLVRFGVASADKITVIPNGADHFESIRAAPAVIAQMGLKPGAYVLSVAGAQRHKNLGVLFEAFASPALLGLTLVVAGADGAPAFSAAGFQPPPGALFAGSVSNEQLRALYEGALCLAFPSTTEGFGLPPLEAMSLGCPVIVAPCGALPEVCRHAALYAAPNDPSAWVEAISRLWHDTAFREGKIRAGTAQAGGYRWADSARRLLEVIEGVAGAPGP